MAKKGKAVKEDKPKSSKPFVVVAMILAFAIAIGTWGYLIKTNKFFGLGELLRPRLKDIPIVCMILPEITDPNADPNLMAREEINTKYTSLLEENTNLQKSLSDLKLELANKNEVEEKYKILLKEVERQAREISNYENIAKENENKVEVNGEEKLKNLVKIYESMDASEAAKILEEIGELNISLVVDICRTMKTATFAEVMQNMSTEFAAILSERMAI